ncbi:MAG TPA: glycosyltransferase family 1 protein [Pseudomonas sp.]|uniref:glycosyltransferase family 4 protein n=1 Tax=Pseudomonas sp. TaxID=306 RepID=UPI002BF2C254|nr:glycosyltransferase family 1 protein [Pseudomonas sp.]HTO18655.1 glycosyltransferase family 1 protein [Pseudomonas sp.]
MKDSTKKISPSVGVDFHAYDGIYQGSRSHVIALFKLVVCILPEVRFFFFLDKVENLLSEHPEFNRGNVTLVRMRPCSGVVRLFIKLPWLRFKNKISLLHTQYRIPIYPLGDCACTIHDVLFETHPEYFPKLFTWQSKFLFRYAARNSKLLFTVSEYSRSEISRCYSISPEKIKVIYNGVDRSRFHPDKNIDPEGVLAKFGLVSSNYILTIGRLEPRKNHLRLIEAYSKIGENAPPLVCVGQKDFGYDSALAAAEKFGISAKVIFLENVNDDVLPILLRNARLFVFPAIAEGFGMPVVEALASGVPVITSSTTSLIEVAGRAAELVDPLDVESIANGMKRILSGEIKVDQLRSCGLKHIDKFDWRVSAEILADSYRKYFSL